jgi:hypothetical protein
LLINTSLIILDVATYPPKHPKALLKLLICISIMLFTPRCQLVPENECDEPRMKSPCASSTTIIALLLLATLHISCSCDISPFILNIPSVITIFFPTQLCINLLRHSLSLCPNTLTFAQLNLQASIMLA